jgi:hypothetical protein
LSRGENAVNPKLFEYYFLASTNAIECSRGRALQKICRIAQIPRGRLILVLNSSLNQMAEISEIIVERCAL